MTGICDYIKWLCYEATPDEVMIELPGSMAYYTGAVGPMKIETVDPEAVIDFLMKTFEPLSVVTGKGMTYHYSDGTIAKFIKCRNTWELKRHKKVYAEIIIKDHFTAEECELRGYNFYNDTIPLERCKGCDGAYYEGKNWTCEGSGVCCEIRKCPYSM